jgi:hypothetical protein
MINSLAALKRALEPGKVLKVVDHSRKELIGTERTVDLTQTNGYWFTQPGDIPPKRWWAEFPKASAFEFHEDGTFSMIFDKGTDTRPPIFARLAFIS